MIDYRHNAKRAVLVLIGLILFQPGRARSADFLSLSRVGGTPAPDSTLIVSLALDNPAQRAGFQVALRFNPTLVSVSSATAGSRLPTFDTLLSGHIDDSTFVILAYSSIMPQVIPAGSGPVALIPFHIAPGVANHVSVNVGFVDAVLADSAIAQVDPVYTTDLSFAVVSVSDATLGAHVVELAQNVPNPFWGSTVFRFSLPTGGTLDLTAFDIMGRKAKSLTSGYRIAGEHRVRWRGDDQVGRSLPPGLYFVRLSFAGRQVVRRVVLLR